MSASAHTEVVVSTEWLVGVDIGPRSTAPPVFADTRQRASVDAYCNRTIEVEG